MKRPFLLVDRGAGSLHVWVGSLGAHLFWPDLWKSRLDWYRRR